GAAFLIVDLGSRNGTLVNGESVKERKLAKGDKIEIGNSVLVFAAELPGRDYRPGTGVTGAVPIPSAHAGAGAADGGKSTVRRHVDRPAFSGEDYLTWPKQAGRAPLWIALAVLAVAGGGFLAVKVGRGGRDAVVTPSGPNLLAADASFEAAGAPAPGAPAHPEWEPRAGSRAAVRRVEGAARTGKTSLVVDLPDGEVAGEAGPAALAVAAGASYVAAVWYRLDGASGAYLKLAWPGSPAPPEIAVGLGAGAAEWARLEIARPVPAGAAQAELSVGVLGHGKAIFDDVSFAPAREPSAPPARVDLGPVKLDAALGRPFALLLGDQPLLADGAAWLREGAAALPHTVLAKADRAAARGRVALAGRLLRPGAAGFADLALTFTARPDGADLALSARTEVDAPELSRALAFVLPGKTVLRVRSAAGGEVEVRERREFADAVMVLAGAGPDAVLLRYSPGPIALRVEPAGGNGMRLEQTAPAGAAAFTVQLGVGEGALAAVSSGSALESAKGLEQARAAGRALLAYRAALKAGKLPPADVAEATNRVRGIERRAGRLLDDLKRKVAEIPELADPEFCAATAREVTAFRAEFEGAEFADQAAPLAGLCTEAEAQARAARAQLDSGRLLALARGFLAEQQAGLAAACLRDLLDRFPGAESAAEARALLERCAAPR
ncbi:MAG: FHA domain-containing protein, partial [Planctomycetes bacterium]|nr:FHA domain-containing protein [Planctomycetota bacterium]